MDVRNVVGQEARFEPLACRMLRVVKLRSGSVAKRDRVRCDELAN